MSRTEGAQSYESLRAALGDLQPAHRPEDRILVWADSGRSLAVSRDPIGRLEIFLVGDPLEASIMVVAENLQHQVWTTQEGASLPANRVLLPDAPHFDGVAAFICSELLENGAAEELPSAFRRSEPVIALALRRAALSNQALVGLAGELFALARMVETLPHRATQVIEGWFGSVPSSRDLQIGAVGVEIKTTSGPDSVHHIQGLHQIEPGLSVDEVPETHLFMLSIGVEWLPTGAALGRSIPDLVDVILEALHDATQRDAFLDRVKQYGGDAAIGYDHFALRNVARFRRPFQTRFERLYDLADDRLHLLRSSDVEHASHVETGSISYRVRLPTKVRGDVNPIAGMSAIVARLDRLLEESRSVG